MSQSSSTVTENGNHRPLNISIEDDPNGGDAAFFDPSNPEFASARQPKKKRRGWKRKLFTWALVLLLIVGGIGALYLVTKVNRVPVKVDAESRRSASLLNGEPVMTTTENGLSAEAINIARQAIGNDPARAGANTSPTPSASPGASPVPTVTPYNGRDLSCEHHANTFR